MGQTHSQEPVSTEELSARLTQSFATKCLTPLELYIFKAVFKAHAHSSSDLAHWPQQTLTSFLNLPTNPGLPISHVIFQLAAYVGAFPFPSGAPAILTNEALLRVVVVLTGRHAKVLRSDRHMWEREIWRGLAVMDRGLEVEKSRKDEPQKQDESSSAVGYEIDQPLDDDEEEDDGEDELVLAAFDAMDATAAFAHGERSNVQHAVVPTDNFLTVIMFLLLIAPLGAQEGLKKYTADLDEELLQDLRYRAHAILTSFGTESHAGISYKIFRRVIASTLPNLFDPLKNLFEHFFYPPDFDLSKKAKEFKPSSTEDEKDKENKDTKAAEIKKSRPLLPDPIGELITHPILSQLSFVLPSSILYHNMSLLYSGSEDGFSMPTFQSSVFNWQSPTILIVSGSILTQANSSTQSRQFSTSLPYKRLKPSVPESTPVTYAAYIPVPWKQTHKAPFGTRDIILFQLTPQHDVFRTSGLGLSFAYFNRHPAAYSGLGFGSPLAEESISNAARAARRGSGDDTLPLGPVSLHIDDSLTYAVFTHDAKSGGGAFAPSMLPASCRLEPSSSELEVPLPSSLTSPVTSPGAPPEPSRTHPRRSPQTSWQDIFAIDALEVYGLGGVEVAAQQERARVWEDREAARRRGINLRTGDIDADRELLKLAGLVGQGQSGGSMG
ncbi:restriction of telomere capping protein 5 [Microthyrium microscopicum]|uniref:Restriction of telomere capping protein 5 n=1 Tax=Microthyrium microscopicum TaxID=703497 RepID=A0A6A6TZZ4_9PEZI|nr:restriction of telomere capping protein 5 [Microthyrium microscopicum]